MGLGGRVRRGRCCCFPFLALSYVAQSSISLVVVSWVQAGVVRYWGPYCHGMLAGWASVAGGCEVPDVVTVRAAYVCIVGGCLRCYPCGYSSCFLASLQKRQVASPALSADQTTQPGQPLKFFYSPPLHAGVVCNFSHHRCHNDCCNYGHITFKCVKAKLSSKYANADVHPSAAPEKISHKTTWTSAQPAAAPMVIQRGIQKKLKLKLDC